MVKGTLAPPSLPFDDFPAVVVDPTNSSVVYAAGMGSYKRADAGATWTRVNTQIGLLSIAASQQNPSLLYAGHQSFGILKSTDGGKTVDFLTGFYRFSSIAVDPADSNTFYAASTARALSGASEEISNDSKKRWRAPRMDSVFTQETLKLTGRLS